MGAQRMKWVAALAATARSTSVYKEERFSDHAPLTVDYAFEA